MLRLFVVGCPRSGTTLLQSLLLSTESIVSFPESHFFMSLSKCPRRIPPGIYGNRLVNRWLDKSKVDYSKKHMTGLSRAATINYFLNTLDCIANKKSSEGWLEKTPGHVHHIGTIQKHIPDAKFLHIIRSYQDNIASLYLARSQWGDPSSPMTTARNWFGHVSKSLFYLNHENHCHIAYEDLIERPSDVIETVTSFTGLKFPDLQDLDLSGYAKQIVEKNEPWKNNNLTSQKLARTDSKFSQVFTKEEQEEINDYIRSVSRWLSNASVKRSSD